MLVNGGVISVYHIVVATATAVGVTTLTLGCGILIQLLGHSIESLLHFVGSVLDGLDIVALVDFLQFVNSGLNGDLFVVGNLVAQLAQSLFGLINQMLGVVVGVDFFLLCLIFGSELLSFLHSLVDFVLGQVGGSGDGDILLLAGAQVLSGDLYDAIGVNVEGNFDLGNTTGSGCDAGQLEVAQGLVSSAFRASPE